MRYKFYTDRTTVLRSIGKDVRVFARETLSRGQEIFNNANQDCFFYVKDHEGNWITGSEPPRFFMKYMIEVNKVSYYGPRKLDCIHNLFHVANDIRQNNVDVVKVDEGFRFFANKQIKKGDQLFINFSHFHESHHNYKPEYTDIVEENISE